MGSLDSASSCTRSPAMKSPENAYCFGRHTAWLLPLTKSFAVSILHSGDLHRGIYRSIYRISDGRQVDRLLRNGVREQRRPMSAAWKTARGLYRRLKIRAAASSSARRTFRSSGFSRARASGSRQRGYQRDHHGPLIVYAHNGNVRHAMGFLTRDGTTLFAQRERSFSQGEEWRRPER